MNLKRTFEAAALALLGLSMITLFSCGEDEDAAGGSISLQGKVNGNDWSMRFGKAEVEDVDPKISSLFISTQTSANNPCDIVFPGNDYIAARLPKEVGTFTLPFPISSESVTFRFAEGGFLVSTGGTVEITAINGDVVTGFIDAVGDADNFIRGNFVLQVCEED